MKHQNKTWLYCVVVSLFLLISSTNAKPNAPVRVKVPLASVHARPSENSEQVTQVLLGDLIEVKAVRGDWAKVLVPEQYRTAEGYPGWIRVEHLRRDTFDETKRPPIGKPCLLYTSPSPRDRG